jgi:hypothetical protein
MKNHVPGKETILVRTLKDKSFLFIERKSLQTERIPMLSLILIRSNIV